jgi:hypothetical protein
MYKHDAIPATLKIIKAPARNLAVGTSYNLAAMSFSPTDLPPLRKQLKM